MPHFYQLLTIKIYEALLCRQACSLAPPPPPPPPQLQNQPEAQEPQGRVLETTAIDLQAITNILHRFTYVISICILKANILQKQLEKNIRNHSNHLCTKTKPKLGSSALKILYTPVTNLSKQPPGRINWEKLGNQGEIGKLGRNQETREKLGRYVEGMLARKRALGETRGTGKKLNYPEMAYSEYEHCMYVCMYIYHMYVLL